jgi:type IV pilus assembly protein PilY1
MTASFQSSASQPRIPQCLLALAAILALAHPAQAAVTDIASQPLASLPDVAAPPNLLFILDNSGSMASAYMPDDMNNTSNIGYYSAQCNGTAYDPSHTYLPPVDYTNKSYTPPTYPTAWTDGYKGSGGGTHDVSSDTYYVYTGGEKRMNWTYPLSNGAKVDKTTVFYGECNTSTSATGYSSTWVNGGATGPGFKRFTPVNVSDLDGPGRQNYINWYTYYRTRTLMMRTSMGLSINKLDDKYNVGFTVISNSSAAPSATFLDTKSFSDKAGTLQSATSQKGTFYTDLYAATGNSNTPLRGALSKAGQYFAYRANGQKYDPLQYACQRNYALLSTDGYWNTGTEKTSAPKYGPYQMDNTTSVGNQDGTEADPMKDSSFSATTTTTVYKTATNGATRIETTTQTTTTPWTRTSTTTSSIKSGTKYPVVAQPQTYSEVKVKTCVQTQVAQALYTNSVTKVNGTTTSTSNSTVSYTGWVNSGTASCTTTDTGAGSASSAWTNSGSPNNSTSSTKGNDTPVYTPSVGGSAGTAATTNATSDSVPAVTGSYTAGTPTTGNPVITGGSSDTLADIAEYYYATDLRNANDKNAVCSSTSSGITRDVCDDDVPPDTNSGDNEKFQHMNTFTLGLGVSGTIPYDSTVTPTKATTMDWPTPTDSSSGGDATNVDDLWHAALNGRGKFYSVLSASDLSAAISSIVDVVQSVAGSGSSAATSSLSLVSGAGNRVYEASYTTVQWTGEVQAFSITASDGSFDTTQKPAWAAQHLLDELPLTSRKVYFNKSGTLTNFSYDKLPSTLTAYFDNFCSKSISSSSTIAPSQCDALAVADSSGKTPNLDAANSGANLVSYLAGTRTFETAAPTATPVTTLPLYRARAHLLGDIVGGAPVYVGKPPFSYADAGYADFVSKQSGRQAMLYVAANDGMLHALSAANDSTGGVEQWAFVPTAVMPNLFKLANASYSKNHQYFVDGAPSSGDVYINGAWKTILVGGFNDGGQGYYALDITDPTNPVMLWEFTDTNLGLSYGNPVITKRKDGTWVVVFGSGYNNTAGDGNGHLFVVDAATGAKKLDICTDVSSGGSVSGGCPSPAGTKTTPSGLAKINTWIDDVSNNYSLRFYGGDLLGNVWRFDIDSNVAPNQASLLLATLTDSKGAVEPITTQPQTVAIGAAKRAFVVVGTGRFLSQTDTTTTSTQSVYAIADDLTAVGWGDPRSGTNKSKFIQQTFTLNGDAATATSAQISTNAVDLTKVATVAGWYVDFPHDGERVFADMALQLNTLVISTGIPGDLDACTAGGKSWLYYLNVATGSVVTNNPAGSQYSSEALIEGLNWVKDTSGNIHIYVQDSKGGLTSQKPPVNSSGTPGSVHRTSWRELTN